MAGERRGGAQALALGQGEGTKDPVVAAVEQSRGAEDLVAVAVGQGLDAAVLMVVQGGAAEDLVVVAVGQADHRHRYSPTKQMIPTNRSVFRLSFLHLSP